MKKKGATSRFPVARIKKIMQADEDVGKVAQATPLLVSKAVELFMAELVKECVDQAGNRGSKKVQPYHLKQAVHDNDSFDFLKDMVQTIPDPTGVDDDGEGGTGKGKGKGKRKKKAKKGEEADAAPAPAPMEDEEDYDEEDGY